jgi:hypothetical protein
VLENQMGFPIFLSGNTLVVNTYFCITTEFTPTIELLSAMRPLLAVGRLVAVTQAVKTAVPTVSSKFCKFRICFSENLKYYIRKKNYFYRRFKKCKSNYFMTSIPHIVGLSKQT